MPFKEKDLDVPILPTHMDVTHLQMKIKNCSNVAKAEVDF